ncbi:hypothetical protein HC761_00275 [bacterium]|nr:hypothetical protein [bacterium]
MKFLQGYPSYTASIFVVRAFPDVEFFRGALSLVIILNAQYVGGRMLPGVIASRGSSHRIVPRHGTQFG